MFNSFRMLLEKLFAITNELLFLILIFIVFSSCSDNVVMSEKIIPIKTETKATRKHTKSFLTEDDIKNNAVSSIKKAKVIFNLLNEKKIHERIIKKEKVNTLSKMFLKAKNKLKKRKYLASLRLTLVIRQRFLKMTVRKTKYISKRLRRRFELTKQEESILNDM